MRKKALILLLTISLTGCGSTNHVDLSNTDTDQHSVTVESSSVEYATSESNTSEENTSEVETTTVNTEPTEEDSKETEIILYMLSFGGESIEEYIENLKTEHPDNTYSVYNDEYYITTIKESERLKALESWKDKSVIDESFSDIFTAEQYAGAFLSMDYDDNFQHFTFYVDKEKYKENEFACALGIGIIVNVFSDTYQAYSLIPPEDRITEVQIIDNETGEVLNTED